MDTVNMANQMVNFQGKEISLDDFMIMYDNFKNMMGKVSKKFLEPIEVKGDKNITLKINPDHENDYVGGLEFVRNMLIAKGEQQPLRLLFQAWMVAKEDFCYYLKELILHSTIGDGPKPVLDFVVMPFDGVDPMYRYDQSSKKVFALLNKDLESYKNEVALQDSVNTNGPTMSNEDIVKKTNEIINVFGDLGKKSLKYDICQYKDVWSKSSYTIRMLISIYRRMDLGEELFGYSCCGGKLA